MTNTEVSAQDKAEDGKDLDMRDTRYGDQSKYAMQNTNKSMGYFHAEFADA